MIGIIFQLANRNFLTPLNLTNLMVQIAAVGTISVGIVLVLLIGEIDLSVGAVSGLCAAIMAVLSVKDGCPARSPSARAILAGALIGLLQGWWFAKLHVPSFVVTLAGFLGWQGALLYVLGSTGTVNLTDPLIIGLANTRLPVWRWAGSLGIIFVVAVLWRSPSGASGAASGRRPQRQPIAAAGRARFVVVGRGHRCRRGHHERQPQPRGRRPHSGRALGGGDLSRLYRALRPHHPAHALWAAHLRRGRQRRSGPAGGYQRRPHPHPVFVLCSTLAACGGILAGSRLLAVNQSSGSGDLLLNAIAAAVIGGTSLFGGRGSTWSALLGALVIGSIANGMDLLALESSIKFMVTGAVLLLAVTIDAVTRSRRETVGKF